MTNVLRIGLLLTANVRIGLLLTANVRIGLLLAAFGLVGCDQVADRIIARGTREALGPGRTDLLDDGRLNVVLCGTGSPLAAEDRAASCTAILAGGHFFVVDAGPASVRNLALWRLPLDRLDGVLVTHFHSDHIGDLGELATQSWIAGRKSPLPVYGPEGVDRVVAGFAEAYALDRGYRVAHHGLDAMPAEGGLPAARTVDVPGPDGTAVVFAGDGLRVTAFRVDHTPVAPAYGYRFDYGGRSVVVSGDTKRDENLAQHARGASMLIHEALAAHIVEIASRSAAEAGNARLAKLSGDILEYHTTPVQAAELAREAGVETLVLTHLVPAPRNTLLEWVFMRGVDDAWDGQVVLGEDGMLLVLPKDSQELVVEELS